MLPLQLPGIALAGRLLLSKYAGKDGLKKSNLNLRLFPQLNSPHMQYTMKNPFETVVRGLQSGISQIRESTAKVDYEKIVKSHIPEDAVLLKPKYPGKARTIHFADIDGHSKDEIIASYRDYEGIKTIILKSRNGSWEKVNEIKNLQYDSLDYMRTVGKNGKQLLLGLTSNDRGSCLYGYSTEENNACEIFARNYSRFEVLKQNAEKSGKARIAIWNLKGNGAYDVELLDLNGSESVSVDTPSDYYYKRMAPYHAEKIKRNPYYCLNWYNLAEALEKAGERKDALAAVDIGIKMDKEAQFKDDFEELKKRILANS